jgi:DNA repair exonuclease SbcCD ATPase subunit
MLGSASFTPFMQLHLGARREIIEDILDISIFTSMNSVLKTKLIQLENDKRILEGEIEVAKQKANIQEQYIQTLEDDKSSKISEIHNSIKEADEQIKISTATKNALDEEKASLHDPSQKKKQLEQYRTKFESQIQKHRRDLDFFHNTDECPTCQQGIEHDHKEIMTQRDENKISELESALQELDTQYSEVEELVNKVIELDEKIMDTNNEMITQQRIIQRLNLELSDTETKTGNITDEKDKLKKLAKKTLGKVQDKTTLTEDEHYYDVAKSMLQDTGIKTKIIKAYLPIINKLVNKYLQAMDFFVQFDLDETFKETIKSRHRDKFTWRTIAKMKNSASTNILLLDEVFDSSLDNQGTDYVMSLLNTIGDDTNVFVISHKGDQLFDKFRSVIRFEKRQNYSVLENRKRENEI